MSSTRDNPLARFSAFIWGIGTFLLFVIGLAVIWFFNREAPSTLEDAAAAKRYDTKAAVFAAEESSFTYKEIEAGKKVQVPPRDVFNYLGEKLASTKPAAVDKPEQRLPWLPPIAENAGPKIDPAAIDKMGPQADAPLDPAVLAAGKAQYMLCAACHGQNGEGTAAGPVHAGSEWVNGPVSNLIRIQMRGLQGPITIKGVQFSAVPMMVPAAYQTDEQIAAVLTYVRNSFGNKASAVSVDQVKALRGEVGKPPLTEADLTKP